MIQLFHKVVLMKLEKVSWAFQLVGSRMWYETDGQMYSLISHETFYLINFALLERYFKVLIKTLSNFGTSFGLISQIWLLMSFTFDLSSQNMAGPHGLNL